MPARYHPLDSEEGRLPDGMERVGYDADTEVYTYQDSDGSYYQGEPGNRYGVLRPTGTWGTRQSPNHASFTARKAEDWRYIAPFFLLVALFLLIVWHFFGPTLILKCGDGLRRYQILAGDTCWKIAESRGTTVEQLTTINKGISCNKLRPGMQICIP